LIRCSFASLVSLIFKQCGVICVILSGIVRLSPLSLLSTILDIIAGMPSLPSPLAAVHHAHFPLFLGPEQCRQGRAIESTTMRYPALPWPGRTLSVTPWVYSFSYPANMQ
jgi:hypothetical protein